MKLLDVFLFILYGAATGYAVYFIASIYNKPATVVVYDQPLPYPETVIYPWNSYNWWPYWGGWWSGGSNGGYGYGRGIGHRQWNGGNYSGGGRPWGSGGRGANGGGGRGANGGGGRGGHGGGGYGGGGHGR